MVANPQQSPDDCNRRALCRRTAVKILRLTHETVQIVDARMRLWNRVVLLIEMSMVGIDSLWAQLMMDNAGGDVA